MEPLTEIQLLELDEISKLPPDQQQSSIKEFFSKLKPEQIEWLKNQQHETSGGQCPFCLIAEGKKLSTNWQNGHIRYVKGSARHGD